MHTKTILAVAVATLLVQAQAAPPQALNNVAVATPQDTQADEFDLSNNTNYEEADDEDTIVKLAGVEEPEKEELEKEGLEETELEKEDLAGEVNEASVDKKSIDNKASTDKKLNEASVDKKVNKAHHVEEEDDEDTHAAEINKPKGMAKPATAKNVGTAVTDEGAEKDIKAAAVSKEKGSKKAADDDDKEVDEDAEGAEDSEKADDGEKEEGAEDAEKTEDADEAEVTEPASEGEEKDVEGEEEEEGAEVEAQDDGFGAAEEIAKAKGSASVSMRASASSQVAGPSGLSLSFSGAPSGLARPSTAIAARPSASAGSAKVAKSNGNLVRVSVGATVGAAILVAFSLL